MRVLLAVLIDLYRFLQSIFLRNRHVVAPTAPLVLPLPQQPALLSPLHPATTVVAEVPGREVDEINRPQIAVPDSGVLSIATERALLRHDPTSAFDNVVAELSYATPVHELRRSGRWLQVRSGEAVGWVLADCVAPAHEVMPQFRIGYTYTATDAETQKLRAYIGDAFYATSADAPLMGVEYVTYRLLQQGRRISWPQQHNRLPGTWQRKLRGQRGVHIDIMPHTGSVIEYIIDDVGYVGYVERVAPDLKILVSGIGLTFENQYTEQTLPHSIWRELHPVFISVA